MPQRTDKILPAEKLLIEMGLDRGADHFSRGGSVGALCLPCTAAALVCLQSSAPSGGRGHLTSLRGGGPLTTLVVAADPRPNLWLNVWLNVLPADRFADTPADLTNSRALPWLLPPLETEPSKPLEISPEDAHRIHAFFAMPRRIWLEEPADGNCGLCGTEGVPCISGFRTRPNGIRYTGAWRHPLSPYRLSKDGVWLAVKGTTTGLGYRHWLGLAVTSDDGKTRLAQPVEDLLRNAGRYDAAGDLRLWAFGYSMDNMRAESWNEGLMPLFDVAPEQAASFGNFVRNLVDTANQSEFYLRAACKRLLTDRPKDLRKEPPSISQRFWDATETQFYEHARRALDDLESPDLLNEVRESWLRVLRKHALELFEREIQDIDHRATDPARMVQAWATLRKNLFSSKLHTLLGLASKRQRSTRKAG